MKELLSDEERKILRFYLQHGERLEGFTRLVKRLERLGDLGNLHQDIELIEEFWRTFKGGR